MSRYNRTHDTTRLFEVVEEWRERCLLSDGSLLTDEPRIWTADNVEFVRQAFKGNPDDGSDPFLVKLSRQLSGVADGVIQLAAETLYIMLLFPTNIGPAKKRENIQTILKWRSTPPKLKEANLSDATLAGTGSCGQGFNQNRHVEFGYFLDFLSELKSVGRDKLTEILTQPWQFAIFLTRVNAPNRQMPHILEHLLFPDTFERIASGEEKRRVIVGLTDDDPRRVKAMNRADRDRRLLALRGEIAQTRGSAEFDFYDEEYLSRWRAGTPTVTNEGPSATAATWAEITSLEHGHGGAGWELGQWLWSPTRSKDGADRYSVMRLPQPGDEVFHFVAGVEPNRTRQRYLYGRSRVAAPAVEVTDKPSAPGDWGAAEAYYKIALDNFVPADPRLPMEGIESRLEDVIATDLAERPKYYPYAGRGGRFRLSQGIYLAKLTNRFSSALDRELGGGAPKSPQMDEQPFGLADAMAGLFMPSTEVEAILELWRSKKNIILQGAPGVGKSFVAKRLAYALMGTRAPHRVETVQFHQSYAYEDFVQGYRPTEDRTFELRDGVFMGVCTAARRAPDKLHVLIIDEINRGNLSKIFGELMLLVEADKRAPEWATRLAYSKADEERFFVPDNLYIIGMMNTADRSLSMVDYALRRRFAFATLHPQYAADGFRDHLVDRGADPRLVDRLVGRMGDLNSAIASDTLNLGPGFEIGHSFFVPPEGAELGGSWYERIVRTEIVPLLEEYWFDERKKALDWRDRLLAP